ncbi:MAG: sigma-E processing peptidase SpoIIGA [Defluviitaleaceae bacterium]|nr:sigma-E processing peptidase SpoIIGA [Defluviitaleaceae bacterium]
MDIEIYADMVFLVNFVVNTAVLGLANALCKRRAKIWKLLLGGATAALFYTVLIFTPLQPFLNVFTSFVVLSPAVVIAHGVKGWRRFGVDLAVAYVCAFALGGLALVVMNIFTNPMSTAVTFATPINLIISILLAFGGIKFVRHYMAKKAMSKQHFCNITIHLNDKKTTLTALMDTGMTLIEPIGQNPVIIAEIDALHEVLPLEIIRLYENKQQDDLEAVAAAFEFAGLHTKMRIIPFKSIGKQSGLIAGFKANVVQVEEKLHTNIVIGICDFKLDEQGEYSALMGADDID